MNPLVSKMELASTLRHARTAAGKTLEDAAAALEVSAATISRIETGMRIPRARDVRELCRFYGMRDESAIEAVAGLVAAARSAGWWEKYPDVVDEIYGSFIALESAATEILHFENMTIPAMLQTAEYQRSFLRDYAKLYRDEPILDDDLERLVEVRRRRQEILDADGPLNDYVVVLGERIVRFALGGPVVMRAQLEHLLTIADDPRVDLRVLAEADLMSVGPVGPYIVLGLPQEQVSDAVYVDLLHGQSLVDDDVVIARHRKIFLVLARVCLE